MYGKEVENGIENGNENAVVVENTGAVVENSGAENVNIVEIFEELKISLAEVKKVSEQINEIEKKISGLKEQLRELENTKHNLLMTRRDLNVKIANLTEKIQSELGFPIFGRVSLADKTERKTEKTGEKTENKRFGFRVKIKTTEHGVKMGLQQVDNIFDSVKEAYYSLYPDRRGKSYKFRELIEKLAERGLIELTYL